MVQQDILSNTPFTHPCKVYKESTVPILKDNNISDQCKETGKIILNNTKNPLCQYVDVLIPNITRTNQAQRQMQHFKTFFGEKYIQTTNNGEQQDNTRLTQKTTGNTAFRNACIDECPTTEHILEFIESEETYVKVLEELVHRIMKPIKESMTENKPPILDQYSYNKIFINTEDLLDMNTLFLKDLKEYEEGKSTESFGKIVLNHISTFDCYKIFFLGKDGSMNCHTQNVKQNKNYQKFTINRGLNGSLGINDLLITPVQRLGKYDILMKLVLKRLEPDDPDVGYLKQALSKLAVIADLKSCDFSLLNLYHLIRDAPASLIQPRDLLAHFDATEISLVSGRSTRPVTILVFTDKIMVVKRKNFHLQGKEYLDKIEEKVLTVTGRNSLIQKAKEVYNGLPFDFKGWCDIKTTEVFNGLKDRPDTFFLRTCLSELAPDATETDSENYFRRSDRLFSIIPNTNKTHSIETFVQKKHELIKLCQTQVALSKILVDGSVDLYHENKLAYPAFTHFYDEDAYRQAEFKNHILAIYVEDNFSMQKIDLNLLVDDNVWIIVLLTLHENGGYKPTIRARTSLTPIRDSSRDTEYESIVSSSTSGNSPGAPLDFIDTLWNTLFYYERRLRVTDDFSSLHDDLLCTRARSLSKSKTLNRVASNMSIGKLFTRSRSTSPSRHLNDDQDITTALDNTNSAISFTKSGVSDPVFKVATVNKQMESEIRDNPHATNNSIDYFATESPIDNISNSHHRQRASYSKPSKIDTRQQQRRPYSYITPSEKFARDEQQFMNSFANHTISEKKQFQNEDALYSANTSPYYQEQQHSFDYRNYQRHQSTSSFESMLYQQSPEILSRPSSGGGSSSASSSEANSASFDPSMSRGAPYRNYSACYSPGGDSATTGSHAYSSVGSANSSRSYFDDTSPARNVGSPYTSQRESFSSIYSNSTMHEEHVSPTMEGQTKWPINSRPNSSSRRAPLHSDFYNQPSPRKFDSKLNENLNGMIDDLIQQQYGGLSRDNSYENSSIGSKSKVASKIDKFINDLGAGQRRQSQSRYQS